MSATAPSLIKDSTIETFAEDVMVASQSIPIIVDFWATWCGPCKTLGPILEKAVTELNGQVRMVKVDIDQNQMLAQQLRIQSVPTVMAFIGGQPVDGFAGALPESEIKAFLDRVLAMAAQAGVAGGGEQGPNIKATLSAAHEALSAGDITTATTLFSEVAQLLEKEDNDDKALALAGLALCHLATGNREEAQQVLALIPDEHKQLEAVQQVEAQLALSSSENSDLAAAKAKAEAAPDDLQALYDYATALISAGQYEAGGDILLNIIAKNRSWNEEAARKKLLTMFEALGPMHETSQNLRRKLSAVLFS
ncbi:MAG: thioredoxin [bacterium]